MFHVETTAWEGELAYKPKKVLDETVKTATTTTTTTADGQLGAEEKKWFWSK